MNNQRVSRQNRRSSLESKEDQKARKALLQAQNEVYEEEGLLHGSGIADLLVSILHVNFLGFLVSENLFFKRVYLEMTFFIFACSLTQKVQSRSL
ncbi:hypothetical protein TNIN_209591 [Trichonephila inaurata madagascariensis]|uniref:Uncharacterized protein n=1 Tax=Trichonephila inaurata madagascariensis TaxID=2747483 RepID=A0A8X6WLZ8_9ARAC|nr:hypothetical protein TNIN_209591 [Trichonephila inaurata madagascariensis]